MRPISVFRFSFSLLFIIALFASKLADSQQIVSAHTEDKDTLYLPKGRGEVFKEAWEKTPKDGTQVKRPTIIMLPKNKLMAVVEEKENIVVHKEKGTGRRSPKVKNGK